MSSAFLEIIQLDNGDFVLQSSEEGGEPLVSIKFSDEAKAYIEDANMEVAKAMIQAGMQAVAQLDETRFKKTELSSDDEDGSASGDRVLH